MKFKNSKYEERYNEYWNNNVVKLDDSIRCASLGFDKEADVYSLISTYQRHILNFLSNIDRQAHLFDDKDYLQQYKNNTINQAVEDLSFYASLYPEYKDISADFLKTFGRQSSIETLECDYLSAKYI